jgi:hypothetical protein
LFISESVGVDKEKVMTRKNITSLITVVVFGSILWAGLVALDSSKGSPAYTAEEFARAYYQLDPSLAQWMYGASSAACGKCAASHESKTFPETNCSKKSADCSEAASAGEPINCSKAASGDESVALPKTAANCESANCAKTVCCRELARRVNTAVDNYLYEAKEDAAERGFSENFAKYMLYHVETQTEYLDDASAVVHLTAHRRMEINPVFAYIAGIFRIGDTYPVDASIHVKRENGQWRVCESSLLPLKTS